MTVTPEDTLEAVVVATLEVVEVVLASWLLPASPPGFCRSPADGSIMKMMSLNGVDSKVLV